jgi:superfamily II DNA or RNA helicase
LSLASRTTHNFTSGGRSKGEAYFRRGAVEITRSDETSLVAQVHGSSARPYKVELDWSLANDKHYLEAACSCPHFADGALCKHLWATILTADRDDVGPTGTFPLEVVDFDDDRFDDEGFDEDYDEEVDDSFSPARTLALLMDKRALLERNSSARARYLQGKKSPPTPSWRRQLDVLAHGIESSERHSASREPSRVRQAWYCLNTTESQRRGRLIIEFRVRESRRNGELGKLKELRLSDRELASFPDPEDRAMLGMLLAGPVAEDIGYRTYYSPLGVEVSRAEVRPPYYDLILPRLCATGRFYRQQGDPRANEGGPPLAWDAGEPWRFELEVSPTGQQLQLAGVMHRDAERVPLTGTKALLRDGLVVFHDRLARLDAGEAGSWLEQMRVVGPVTVPAKDRDALLERLWQMPVMPPVQMPDEMRFAEVRVAPQPRIQFRAAQWQGERQPLRGMFSFDYGGSVLKHNSLQAGIVDRKGRRVLLRDRPAERAAWDLLFAVGARTPPQYERDQADVVLDRKLLPRAVAKLTAAGWHCEAEGLRFRRPGEFSISVASGVDWFDLSTALDFEGVSATLPQLLAAVRQGDQFVTLSDGTQGMLPEEWLRRFAPLAELGEAKGDSIRFRPTQAALLDALLAAQGSVRVDKGFERWRERLRKFTGIQAADQPPGFVGQLREYQREGLGWIEFLREFGFGGCLADDMGLGKTIQVLALLEKRRTARKSKNAPRAPSLVVAPRSLIHNWIEEATRFAPKLKVLDYTGLSRADRRQQFAEADLIVTTYGTLRRDIPQLKDVTFEYAILDEAQAIKNSASQAAKACRLIEARHRLAMTGTPVENHLGELWSLFEFLNPGMLGRSSAMKWFGGGKEPDAEEGGVKLLAQALRPYLLRRTKEQVLRELPAKTEQTLYCELEPKQRKYYNEIRDHYRAHLLKKVEELGLERSKIHVLEALLRLRQAACHPGLLDKSQVKEPSAKLETLLEQVREVIDGGHKALVFSQFTSLLAIVRQRLDSEGLTYEYLDGKTRDRKQRVDRFQQDAACKLFLISLKAGGLGLNLTAADYVFILDPWWNPAVEAQAVDRAHRIGQERPVFAYRLIARDTVEEKILELQGDKRRLAEAIVGEDNSLISGLTAEDLTLLLS